MFDPLQWLHALDVLTFDCDECDLVPPTKMLIQQMIVAGRKTDT